ncbi:MAG: hypothetical protein U0223_18820 [Nitrospira sp.]
MGVLYNPTSMPVKGWRIGLLGIDRRVGRAGVLVGGQRAVVVPNDQVEIAVAVEVAHGGAAVRPDIDAGEGVGGSGLLGIARRAGRAGVLVGGQRALVFPDDQIEIAVAVEVAQGGGAELLDIDAGEGVGGSGLLGIARRAGRAGVLVGGQRALVFPDDQIEIAVAVEVAQGGGAELLDIDAGEGVGGSGLLGIARRAGRAGVLVGGQRALVFPDDQIEIAVAVEVAQGGGAGKPDINAGEGVGGSGLFKKIHQGPP